MMEWNVYMKDFNKKSIEIFNVFNSHRFCHEVNGIFAGDWYEDEFDDFSEELHRAAMYAFWGKCEYEVVVTSWPPYITQGELLRINKEAEEPKRVYNVVPETAKKIDIYHQLQLNWHRFAIYVWECYHNGEDVEG